MYGLYNASKSGEEKKTVDIHALNPTRFEDDWAFSSAFSTA